MEHADPRSRLEPFEALIGEWTMELTHPAFEGTVIRGTTSFEWLEGSRFLIQRSANDHPDFPDSISVIGVMEDETDLSMQYCAGFIGSTRSGSTGKSSPLSGTRRGSRSVSTRRSVTTARRLQASGS